MQGSAQLDNQFERLADCDCVFHEKVSGKSTRNRPELQNALDFVRDGDVFAVTKLDRLARSVVDLANIVQKFEVKNVDMVVLFERWGRSLLIQLKLRGFDTST